MAWQGALNLLQQPFAFVGALLVSVICHTWMKLKFFRMPPIISGFVHAEAASLSWHCHTAWRGLPLLRTSELHLLYVDQLLHDFYCYLYCSGAFDGHYFWNGCTAVQRPNSPLHNA